MAVKTPRHKTKKVAEIGNDIDVEEVQKDVVRGEVRKYVAGEAEKEVDEKEVVADLVADQELAEPREQPSEQVVDQEEVAEIPSPPLLFFYLPLCKFIFYLCLHV